MKSFIGCSTFSSAAGRCLASAPSTRTNVRPPNGNRSAGAFGTITATYDPRQLQLGFKLNF